MSLNTAVAFAPPSTGTTRDCDLELTTVNGAMEVGASVAAARNLRTGNTGSATGIGVSQTSCSYALTNGRMCIAVASGLGNGAMIQYGVTVNTSNTVNVASPSAFALRRGVSRFVCSPFASAAVNPNNDVGMQLVIGGGALSQLLANNNVQGPGKSGFGIWMINGVWTWGIKNPNTAQLILSDAVSLAPAAPDVTVPTQMELRVYDQDGGANSVSVNARCEVWIAQNLILTRYWANPAGIATPVLPAFDPVVTGGALYPQIRNTSTGPANLFTGGFSWIHGPANEGTI